ncbi:uL15 family ribosomal protein [Candidatus Woesearchaeota archaeon]|nr:uL15 family ribosomal protein [Candidatus Woesearchaeota archaeon]
MTINKRKKNSRQRGSKTHGWGAMKKHRGAGNRGGRGLAGSGKKSDQLKPTIIKKFGLSNYFGKAGFKRPQKLVNKKIKTMNVGDLIKFNKPEINLIELGFNKLLGEGKVTKKYTIKVESCSRLAKEKIENAGGSIITSK